MLKIVLKVNSMKKISIVTKLVAKIIKLEARNWDLDNKRIKAVNENWDLKRQNEKLKKEVEELEWANQRLSSELALCKIK